MLGTYSTPQREEYLSTREPDNMRSRSPLLVSKRDHIQKERVGLAGASNPFAVVSCDPSEV